MAHRTDLKQAIGFSFKYLYTLLGGVELCALVREHVTELEICDRTHSLSVLETG